MHSLRMGMRIGLGNQLKGTQEMIDEKMFDGDYKTIEKEGSYALSREANLNKLN